MRGPWRITGRAWLVAAMVAAGLGAQEPPPSPPLPDGKALLDRMVAAAGGAEAMTKLTNRHVEGRLEIPARGMKATTNGYTEAPDRSAESVVLEDFGTLRQGIAGGTVWVQEPKGYRLVTGAERSLMLRLSQLHPVQAAAQNYTRFQVKGVVDVGGRPCYRLELTPRGDEQRPETWCVDQQSALVLRMELTIESPHGTLPAAVEFSDYREQDGIQFPFQVVVTQGEVQIHHTYTMCKHNVEIPPRTFEIPAEVKALQESAPRKDAGPGSTPPAPGKEKESGQEPGKDPAKPPAKEPGKENGGW